MSKAKAAIGILAGLLALLALHHSPSWSQLTSGGRYREFLLSTSQGAILDRWQHHDTPASITTTGIDYENDFSDDAALVVETQFGAVRGVFAKPNITISPFADQHKSGRAFLGIPFAEPPIGPRRFTNAQLWTRQYADAFDWPRVALDQQLPLTTRPMRPALRADKFSPACLQLLTSDVSEDCLYANIFVPPVERVRQLARRGTALLPVMFWIYGGAFEFGASGAGDANYPNVYSGAHVVHSKDVVIVTFNYRVNSLGFLRTGNATGTYGVSDQAAALQWTYDNIASFGGDPDNITVFGMSSGAYNAALLAFNVNMPPVRRLISMSGPQVFRLKTDEEARRTGSGFMKKLGCAADDDMECLMGAAGWKLLLAGIQTTDGYMETAMTDSLKWVPPQDDFFSPARPMDLIASPSPELKQRLARMDVMMGTARDEAALFISVIFEVLNLCVGCTFLFLRGANQSLWDYFLSWLAGGKYPGSCELPGKPRSHAARQYVLTLLRFFSEDANAVEQILTIYPAADDFSTNVATLLRLTSDYMFICPSRGMATNMARESDEGKAFVYEVTYQPKFASSLFGPDGLIKKNSVAHAIDVAFFWNYAPILKREDEPVAGLYGDYFTAFARGDINDHAHPLSLYQRAVAGHQQVKVPNWPQWTATEANYLSIGKNETDADSADAYARRNPDNSCAFWDRLRSEFVHPGSEYPF